MSVNKSIFYTILAQIPTAILGVASGIFITRILGPNGKGVYAVFQANIEFFGFFLSFNIVSGLIYFVASKKIVPGKLIGMTIYFCVLLLILISLFFETIMHTNFRDYFMPKGYDSFFYVFYMVCTFFCGIVSGFLSGIMQGYKDFKAVNIVTVINGIINLVCFSALYLIMKFSSYQIGIFEILLTALLIAFINAIVTFIFYLIKIRIKPDFDISINGELKPFFKYVSITYIGILINFFNYRLDIWVLMHYSVDLRPVGFYALAVNVAQLLWMISNPLIRVLFPYLSEGHNPSVRLRKTLVYSRLNVSILILAILFLCCLGNYLLPIIYGKDFISSVRPFEVLLIGLFFSSATKPFGTFFVIDDSLIVNVYANTIGVLFTLIFCFWLIPTNGIMGACIATDVSYAAIFVFTYFMFYKKSNYTAKNWFLLRKADLEELGMNKFLVSLKK